MSQLDKTPSEYKRLIKQVSSDDSLSKKVTKAYIIGGLICVVGEVIFQLLVARGIPVEEANPLMAISMITIGGLLTGLGVYDRISQYAGAGTIVPITGFANAVVAPAMEHKQDGYILGVGAKMYGVAGPVLTYGMLTAFLIGVIKLVFI
ncbi:stage V sporulation protein AC [Fuchsiella alkaliacetigena]|uniref:stage V sporulation protein AC n=1 Tax=Fuchsiella alkaliacetigena TaxID=957042 RepID=UPI00200A3D8E|nr:stage V sporulation protein AC [Fuchsiella alkaliacetigena]MCK8825167.1 stage V sporulation protein AC [Fuchsiella alkaliacetigena]